MAPIWWYVMGVGWLYIYNRFEYYYPICKESKKRGEIGSSIYLIVKSGFINVPICEILVPYECSILSDHTLLKMQIDQVAGVPRINSVWLE